MKRPTWILVVIFLALTGLFVYFDRQETPLEEVDSGITPLAMDEFLFPESNDGDVIGITVTDSSGKSVSLERDELNGWVLSMPFETEASPGAAEAAASQLTSLRILSRLQLAPAEAGLSPPAYTLSIEFSNGELTFVRIGDLTPTNHGYYARVEGTEEILILGKAGVDALLGMVDRPPYLNTPTPSPIPPTDLPD